MGNHQNSFIGTSLNVTLFRRRLVLRNSWSRLFQGTIKLKTHQRNFMEKKIKRTGKGTKSGSYSNEEKTIIITIGVALIIISAMLVSVVIDPVEEEYFSAIYYLDSDKSTENLPKTVILDQNSTFTLWVGVENQNSTTLDYSVQLKMDDGTGQLNQSSADAIQIFENTLEHGETWEFPVTIDIEQLGTNRIIFELYFGTGTLNNHYSGKWVNLSVEAIEAS